MNGIILDDTVLDRLRERNPRFHETAYLFVMSALRTTPVPLNVGANTSVFRGIGNFSNASRGTPEMV